jgi:undecaprenyl-diphosphatase
MDLAIAEGINGLLARTFIDFLTKSASAYLFVALFFVIIGLIVFIKDKKAGKIVVLSLVIAIVLHFAVGEGLMKGIFADNVYFRERPYLAYPNEINALGRLETDSSFPSSHMSVTVAFLTVLVFFYRKKVKWILPCAILFSLFMAFARIHNGMHYPSDVIAGTGFGILYGLVAVWAAKKLKKGFILMY